MPVKTKGSQLYRNTKNAVFSKGTYVDVSVADLVADFKLYDYETETIKHITYKTLHLATKIPLATPLPRNFMKVVKEQNH